MCVKRWDDVGVQGLSMDFQSGAAQDEATPRYVYVGW